MQRFATPPLAETQQRTIYGLLSDRVRETPGHFAVMAPGRKPLTFGDLLTQVDRGVQALCELGVTRDSRIAISVPQGPEMAVMHLVAVSAGISSPINPDASKDEVVRQLRELDASVLVVPANGQTAARQAAAEAGVPVVNLRALSDIAGQFELAGERVGPPAEWTPPSPDSVAVLLRTSGTTGTPKLIPQSHGNRAASGYRYTGRRGLQKSDRVINVMPLFHTEGLHAQFLSPLLAGLTVIITPRFDPSKFFGWFEEFDPSYFNGVPTMHQALLPFAKANIDLIRKSKLRFISSSSAPLPWPLKMEMEAVYGVRVIIGYGATEVSGVARTPFPPEEDRPGSVGKLVHNQVGIFDEQGNRLGAGQRGEICVAGPTVVRGYWNNSDADKKAFRDGWYRTGDEGYIDADGYLFLTGRIKEIINRGGEKISPIEVDDVLRAHPAVEQACTFAVKHPTLGEEVAAAVVLAKGTSATEKQIREFAASKLSFDKVPRRLFFVADLPKNVLGKLERTSMAERLGMTWESLMLESNAQGGMVVTPRTPSERMVAELWAHLLSVKAISVHDRFLDLGGDSMAATRLLGMIADRAGVEIPIIDFFEAPTVAEQAALVDAAKAAF